MKRSTMLQMVSIFFAATGAFLSFRRGEVWPIYIGCFVIAGLLAWYSDRV